MEERDEEESEKRKRGTRKRVRRWKSEKRRRVRRWKRGTRKRVKRGREEDD